MHNEQPFNRSQEISAQLEPLEAILVNHLRLVKPEIMLAFRQMAAEKDLHLVYSALANSMTEATGDNPVGQDDFQRIGAIIQAASAEEGAGWDEATHRLLAQRIGAFANFQGWGTTGQLNQVFQAVIDLLS